MINIGDFGKFRNIGLNDQQDSSANPRTRKYLGHYGGVLANVGMLALLLAATWKIGNNLVHGNDRNKNNINNNRHQQRH